MKGLVSDVAIHNRILSLGEIQTLADRSDPTLDGLLVGVASRSRVAFSGGVTPATGNMLYWLRGNKRANKQKAYSGKQ
jgi:hypothetical protein